MASGFGWNYSKRYFDRLLWLSYSGWAWEFRRRKPRLLGEARTSGARPIVLTRDDGIDLVRLPRPCRVAERHGLHFLPDPRLSAYETPLFWLPEAMTTNLDAAAALREHIKNQSAHLSWQDIPGKKSLLLVPGRRSKLTVNARSYSAQLAIDAESTPLPIAIYLTLQMSAGKRMLEKLRCLEQFAHHCSGLEFEIAPRRGYGPEKLRMALIALDGALAGASHREIANVLFGNETVKDDWNNGIHSYKSRTRRLIDKGRALMEIEYRNLL